MSLLSVLTRVDSIHTRTLLMANHSQHRAHPPDPLRGQVTNTRRSGGHEIRGQFVQSYEAGDSDAGLRVTLTVPDEEKVEFFEVESPSGVTQILSKFEDGMVYFTFLLDQYKPQLLKFLTAGPSGNIWDRWKKFFGKALEEVDVEFKAWL